MRQHTLLPPGYFSAGVEQTDPVIAQAIEREKLRTRGVIELILSGRQVRLAWAAGSWAARASSFTSLRASAPMASPAMRVH